MKEQCYKDIHCKCVVFFVWTFLSSFLSKSILSGCYFFEFQSLNKKLYTINITIKNIFAIWLIHYKCEN